MKFLRALRTLIHSIPDGMPTSSGNWLCRHLSSFYSFAERKSWFMGKFWHRNCVPSSLIARSMAINIGLVCSLTLGAVQAFSSPAENWMWCWLNPLRVASLSSFEFNGPVLPHKNGNSWHGNPSAMLAIPAPPTPKNNWTFALFSWCSTARHFASHLLW